MDADAQQGTIYIPAKLLLPQLIFRVKKGVEGRTAFCSKAMYGNWYTNYGMYEIKKHEHYVTYFSTKFPVEPHTVYLVLM